MSTRPAYRALRGKRKAESEYSDNRNTVREMKRREKLKKNDPAKAAADKVRRNINSARSRAHTAVRVTNAYKAASPTRQKEMEEAARAAVDAKYKDEALGASLASPNKSAHPSKSTEGFDDDDDCDDEESLPNIKANVSATKELNIKLDHKDEEEAEIVIDLRKGHEEGVKRRVKILVTF